MTLYALWTWHLKGKGSIRCYPIFRGVYDDWNKARDDVDENGWDSHQIVEVELNKCVDKS